MLHQVLDTGRLDLLQERTARLPPRPEINLSHVFSHGSAERTHLHTRTHTNPAVSVRQCVQRSHTHLDRNCSWFLMVSWIILMKATSHPKRNTRKRFPWETGNTHTHIPKYVLMHAMENLSQVRKPRWTPLLAVRVKSSI